MFRRRNGGAVLRADNFGDLIIADHKVLSDNCESRNNHRYAVVVQDLATQWIQSSPCKNKTSQETQRSLQKFLEPERKPKVISLEFGKACEDLSWNHCTSTPHRSETNGIAERAVRRVKEGTSAVLLQSGLNESWWADSMECYTYLRNVTDLSSDGKTPYERRLVQPFKTGQPVVNRDESGHEQTMLNEVNMDFRIPGLPHSVVKQVESSRVRELVKKIENHPDRQALQIDLQQNKDLVQYYSIWFIG